MADKTQILVKGGQRIGKGSVDIGRTTQVTRFANAYSARTYNPAAEPTAGKIVHIPGTLEDLREYGDNVVYGTRKGLVDYEMPIASFASVFQKDLGLSVLKARFFDHWGQALDELRDDIKQYGPQEAYKRVKRVGIANIVNSAVVDATRNLNILDRVLGLQSRNYFLQGTVTPIPAPNLVFTVDEYIEGSVQAKVPELEEPLLVAHSETRTTKVLYKNVAHLAESEEAMFLASHNTMALRQDKAIRDMARLLNAQIATELMTADATAGADWGAKASGVSTNAPQDDIQPRITAIRGNGFDVDYIAAHDRPAQDLNGNSWVNGGQFRPQPYDSKATRIEISGLPPVVVDQALTDTVAIIGSRDATWLGQGPTIVASYNEDVIGYRGWLIKQYVLPYKAQSGAIAKLTGVSA